MLAQEPSKGSTDLQSRGATCLNLVSEASNLNKTGQPLLTLPPASVSAGAIPSDPRPIDFKGACRCVVGALVSRKPRARYALVAQRFKNWTLPMWLPERWMDTLMAQAFLKK